MSGPQKVSSLLAKLEHKTFYGLELSDLINELLNLSAPIDKVASIVERRIGEGAHVLNETLATLLAKSHSQTLFAKTAEQFKNDLWALLILYKARYPDPEIEKALIKELYKVASKDGEPRRGFIIEAMKEAGSTAVLPSLEAIAHELEPGVKVGQAFGVALGPLGSLSAEARYSFLQEVLVAIDEIKQRAELNPPTNDVFANVSAENEVDFDFANNASQFMSEAEKYLDLSPAIVIFYIRKGAEALAKDLYRHLGLEKGGRPAKRMMLDELMTAMNKGNKNPAPILLQVFLTTFQNFGNFSSHDQDGEEKYLTKETARPLFELYCQALELYARWRRENNEDNS